MEEQRPLIGRFLDADMKAGFLRILIKVDPESVYVNMPIVIQSGPPGGEISRFYGTIINLHQERSDLVTLLARQKEHDETAPEISYADAGMPDQGAPDLIAEMECYKIFPAAGKAKAYKSLPRPRSPVYVASDEEMRNIYDPDPKSIPIPIGFLAANRSVKIPLPFKRLLLTHFGVFGKSRSGKTVTFKNLLIPLIADVYNNLHTRVILFDVHNEYAKTRSDRLDPGIWDLLRDKITIFSIEHDPEKLRKRGITGAKYFRLFRRNISASDIISILSTTDLSEKMIDTIHRLDQLYHQLVLSDHALSFFTLIQEFYGATDVIHPEIDEIIDQTGGREGSSYMALTRRLSRFMPGGKLEHFLADPNGPGDLDTVDTILRNLKSDASDKQSFLLHFGKFGNIEFVYEFVANLIMRRLFDTYSNENDVSEDEEGDIMPLDPCVIGVEEAHKFLGKSTDPSADAGSIGTVIVREGRKYHLTLAVIDQMPSLISDAVMANIEGKFIHRLTNPPDIAAVTVGMDQARWKHIITTLENGEAVLLGEFVEDIPTTIKTFFDADGNQAAWKAFYHLPDGISTSEVLDSLGTPRNMTPLDMVRDFVAEVNTKDETIADQFPPGTPPEEIAEAIDLAHGGEPPPLEEPAQSTPVNQLISGGNIQVAGTSAKPAPVESPVPVKKSSRKKMQPRREKLSLDGELPPKPATAPAPTPRPRTKRDLSSMMDPSRLPPPSDDLVEE